MGNAPRLFESLADSYEVMDVLGEGGSGRVFKVTDSAGKVWALKCLFPHLSSGQKRKRFKNEIDFCAKTQHVNIMQVKDWGLADWDRVKVPFYVMPIFPATLRNLLDKRFSMAIFLHSSHRYLMG